MYTRSSFGSYYPSSSIVHNLNPIIKIINFILTIILVLLSDSLLVIGFMLIFIFILMVLSKVPFKYYYETIFHLRYIFLLIALICWYFKLDVETLIIYIMKLIIVIEYINIISYTTSPSENIYGIEKVLNCFNILFLPVNRIATMIDSALRYFPTYMDTKNKILKSSYSRGVKKDKKMFFVTRRLTKKVIKDNKYASELRLYDIKKYRTNYRTNRLGFNDVIFLLFHIMLVLTYVVQKGLI